MQTYVAEIDGRAIIAFKADSDDQAQTWIETEENVRAELSVLENDGKPLQDRTATINVRQATADEEEALQNSSAWLSGEDGEFDTDELVVFLVPVDETQDE